MARSWLQHSDHAQSDNCGLDESDDRLARAIRGNRQEGADARLPRLSGGYFVP